MFVIITGILDLLLGLFLAIPAIVKADPAAFLNPIMLGAFLMFCGACLIWAAHDIAARAPVIFWQGLVRLAAVATILIGLQAELVPSENLIFALMDGIVGPVYLAGVIRSLRIAPFKILIGRTT